MCISIMLKLIFLQAYALLSISMLLNLLGIRRFPKEFVLLEKRAAVIFLDEVFFSVRFCLVYVDLFIICLIKNVAI